MSAFLFVFRCGTMCSEVKSGVSTERYFTVNNKIVAKIIISRMYPLERVNSRKKDRNKLSIYGLIGYSLNFILLISLMVFAIIPTILCIPYDMSTEDYILIINTLNDLIPFALSVLAILIEFVFACLLWINYITIAMLLSLICVIGFLAILFT